MLRLLLLLLLACSCLAQDSLLLPLYEYQYVTVLVGSTGREVVLRLRWDLNDLVLYQPPLPAEYSTSFWRNESDCTTLCYGTDVIYLGSQRLLVPVLYAAQGALPQQDPLDTAQKVTHHGMLPLGPLSPLWRYWHGWTWSKLFLQLGSVDESLQHTAGVVQYHPGRFRGCWGDGDQCAAVLLSPELDYSFASGDAYTAWLQDDSWVLRCWDNESSSSTEDELLLFVDALSQNQNGMLVDKMYLGLDTSTTQLQLGLQHLSGWVMARDMVEQTTWVAALPNWFVQLRDYVWLLVGMLVLMSLLFPGVYEHVHVSRWHRNQQQYLLKRLPPDQLKALLWMTRFCLWLMTSAMQWMLRPYLAMRLIQHPYATGVGWSDAVYGTLVGYVLLASVFSAAWTRTLVLHLASAVLLCAWSLVALQFHRQINGIMMIVLSGLAFLLQSELLLWSLYRSRRHTPTVLCSLLCTVATAWFFTFYNVALYLQQRWPNHPSAVPIELLTMMSVWCLASFLPFAEEHQVQYRANITREFMKLNKPPVAGVVATTTTTTTTTADATPVMPYNLLAPQGLLSTLIN